MSLSPPGWIIDVPMSVRREECATPRLELVCVTWGGMENTVKYPSVLTTVLEMGYVMLNLMAVSVTKALKVRRELHDSV